MMGIMLTKGLGAWVSMQSNFGVEDQVYHDRLGDRTRLVCPHADMVSEGVRMMLRRRCEAAGIRYASPHAFRHGFAMAWLNAGMHMSAVAAVMGHSSQAVTEAVYAHWQTESLSREYAQALRRLTDGEGR